MELKNIKIQKLLDIGIAITISFIIIVGIIAYIFGQITWKNTKEMYEHPLTVIKTIDSLTNDQLYIFINLKNIINESDAQKKQEYNNMIASYEADSQRQLNILYSRYLGPKSNIDDADTSMKLFKKMYDETIYMLNEGNFTEAINRIKESGIVSIQSKIVMSNLKVISNFANSKADSFYLEAKKQNSKNTIQLSIVIFLIIIATIYIDLKLRNIAILPLREITLTAEELKNKNFKSRSRYKSRNELGVLSSTLNSMAQIIENEISNKDNVTQLLSTMASYDDLRPFCHELLKSLNSHTFSQIAAIYLINDNKTHYEHFASIGLNANYRTSFTVLGHEGEFGAVISTKQIQHLKAIPSDTKFIFSTVSGDFTPKEIITIPILKGDNIIAIISLASIDRYSSSSVLLINNIWSELTARLNSAIAHSQALDFSKKLQNINSELEAQSRELSMQTDELTEQNIELEIQKKQLDEANQLKSSFLSNMSHELRTPLNSIIALSSVLNRHLLGKVTEDDYSYLDIIERNGKNLLSIVNDILDLSRIESGKEEITINQFSMNELITDIVETIKPQTFQKNIDLIFNGLEELPSIKSDMDKCKHIIQNIIGNAIKFTKVGKVEISTLKVNHEIHVTISDTGIGIPPDKLPFIFDEFRQADESTSKNYGGTGLGLAIAKKYAKLLNGNITVNSTLNKGSTFLLRLPLVFDNRIDIEEPTQIRLNQFSCSNSLIKNQKNILLVEDSEPAIIQMNDILSEQGYIVSIVRNGKEALEYLDNSLPDAIILDLMMPEVDGFQVLEKMRNIDRVQLIPVLILTAKHITKDELKFLKTNHVYQLIQKGSVGKDELLAVVKNMLLSVNKDETISIVEPIKNETNDRPLVLIIEDIPDNMTTVKALLKETCDTIEAFNGQDGLYSAKTHRPSIILLDISLPGMDGYMVLKELRSEESTRHIPVIAMTARAMIGDKEEILSHGFDGYISKPIDNELLDRTIRGFHCGI